MTRKPDYAVLRHGNREYRIFKDRIEQHMSIALVTGASSGFGAAIARRLAKDGHKIVLAARRREKLEALAAEIGSAAHVHGLDITDRNAVRALPETLPEKFRDVDILINNAGLALGLDPADRADITDWETMIETNILGLSRITRALLPGMRARDCGHIVNIGSIAATYPYPGGHVYGATKAFVAQFTLNLKADLVGTGVRVSVIEPGLCGGTEFSAVRFHGDHEKAATVYRGTTPLTAEDIAEAVGWCVSLPKHVNINRIEMMPTCQAPGPLAIARRAE
jgi:3-hydroxy acid dehydrogenase/malonic semialdehyde reductase